MFSHLSISHSVHRGGDSASVHAGLPPPSGAGPPRSRHPPGSRHPPRSRHPQSRHPPEQAPLWDQAPPPKRRHPREQPPLPREQTVRIPLECILVLILFFNLKSCVCTCNICLISEICSASLEDCADENNWQSVVILNIGRARQPGALDCFGKSEWLARWTFFVPNWWHSGNLKICNQSQYWCQFRIENNFCYLSFSEINLFGLF